MADEHVQATSEADLDFDLFFERGNKRDRGEEVADVAPQPKEDTKPDAAAAAAAAAATDGQPEDGAAAAAGAGKGKKDTTQERIDKAVAKQRDAERRAEEAERRAQEAEQRAAGRREPEDQPRREVAQDAEFDGIDPDDPKPTLDKFKDEDDPAGAYWQALAGWEGRKESRKLFFREAQKNEQAAEHAAWMGRVDGARKRIPDFDKRLDQNLMVDTRVMPWIQRHPLGPDFLIYLSEHQEHAQALLRLHPIDQIGKLGELAGHMTARRGPAKDGSATPPKPITQATTPTKPLGSSPMISAPEDTDDANDMSPDAFDKHFARENKRDRQRQTGR